MRATADLVELGRVSHDVIQIAQRRDADPADGALDDRLETTVHVVGKLRATFGASELAPLRELSTSTAWDSLERDAAVLLASRPAASDKLRLASMRANSDGLAAEIHAASDALELASEREGRNAGWVSWGLLGLLLAAAAFEGFGIVLPALRRSRRDAEDLAEAELAVLDAADAERVRLGQEMHDGLCQNLGGLRLLANAAKTSAASPSTERTLGLISELAERSLKMTRTFSHGLYPGDVRGDNLADALARLGAEVSESGTFEFTFTRTGEASPCVEDTDAMHVYRIAQEALSNALRHGQPSRVELELGCEGGACWLRIQDNGVGMSTTVDVLAGVGLSSMRARARAMGAEIEICSSPGDGTCVELTFAPSSAPSSA